MRNIRMLLILVIGMITFTSYGMQPNDEAKPEPTNDIISLDTDNVTVEIATINPYEMENRVFLENQVIFFNHLKTIEADCQYTASVFDVGIGKQNKEIELLKNQILIINKRYNKLNKEYRILYFKTRGVLPKGDKLIFYN